VNVFAVYSPGQVGLVRAWAGSWERRKWRARLLSAKEIELHGSARKAADARGGGALVTLTTINFSHRASKKHPFRTVAHGKPGWVTAGVVRFPARFTEDDLLACGREL
jgi:hypothetical protein